MVRDVHPLNENVPARRVDSISIDGKDRDARSRAGVSAKELLETFLTCDINEDLKVMEIGVIRVPSH